MSVRGGLHFITRKELKAGDKVKLEVHAPKVAKPIALKAQVVWVHETSQAGAFRVGVSFLSLSRQNKDQLRQMLDTALMEKVDINTVLYLKHLDRL